jgi:hypothetical protein
VYRLGSFVNKTMAIPFALRGTKYGIAKGKSRRGTTRVSSTRGGRKNERFTHVVCKASVPPLRVFI